jgi:hypothetical protein
MSFPTLIPNSRNFDPGNWPVKSYNAQNGTEIRLLYGNTRFNLQLGLTYSNISDQQAEAFLTHYINQTGTFKAFNFTTEEAAAVFGGWSGTPAALREPAGVEWRYEGPPKIEAVVPGVSTVSVILKGVI